MMCEIETETLIDDNDLMIERDYQDCVESSNITENPNEIAQIKTEFSKQLSGSENELEEELTFDDLYEKVFEDIKSEQLEEQESKISTKIHVKRRRRGRPPLNRRSDSEDTDSIFTLDVTKLDIEVKRNEDNQSQEKSETNAKENFISTVYEFDGESDVMKTISRAKSKGSSRGHRTNNSEQQGPPFVCEICNYPCKSRSLLNSHRFRKHRPQNVAQFNCPKCNRTFNNQQALQRHMRRPTCEAYPQFDCEHCGKKCIGLSNYKIHLRFHKRQYPFVCHLCGKKFMMCVHLNEHVLVKHENKRYPCEHPGCGKLFQTRNSLYNHAYQHKGFMPYECEYCRRGYASKSRLRFHCRKSHNIDHTIEELDRMQVTEKLPNKIVRAQ